jgi:hypothetical protein
MKTVILTLSALLITSSVFAKDAGKIKRTPAATNIEITGSFSASKYDESSLEIKGDGIGSSLDYLHKLTTDEAGEVFKKEPTKFKGTITCTDKNNCMIEFK